MPNTRPLRTLCLATLSLLTLPASAQTTELITNGGFETGDLSGWSTFFQRDPADTLPTRDFYLLAPGSDSPDFGFGSLPTAPNPAGGSFFALAAADAPGASVLLQSFTVPTNTWFTKLSFDLFVNDWAGTGALVDPSGLDYTSGGTFADNFHARVDLLAGAVNRQEDAFETTLGTEPNQVLGSFYLGVDASAPNPFTSYSFDIFSLIVPGQSYTLRFAEVDNLPYLHMGIDNVSVLATAPEPSTAALLLPGAAGLFVTVRRRRAATRKES